jgi:hypothetical protein
MADCSYMILAQLFQRFLYAIRAGHFVHLKR